MSSVILKDLMMRSDRGRQT